jgi:hypothetical protein
MGCGERTTKRDMQPTSGPIFGARYARFYTLWRVAKIAMPRARNM